MKKIRKTTLIIVFISIIFGCNKKENNRIEIKIKRKDLNDSSAIKHFNFELSNQDKVLFKNKIVLNLKLEDLLSFDSLPNGQYNLKYNTIQNESINKKIILFNSKIHKEEIIYDDINYANYIKKTPINNLKNNQSYKLLRYGGCESREESFYIIKNLNGRLLFTTNLFKNKILDNKEIAAIQKFEAELMSLNGKGSCMSTGQMTYIITKEKFTDTLKEMTCNWYGYEKMIKQLIYANQNH